MFGWVLFSLLCLGSFLLVVSGVVAPFVWVVVRSSVVVARFVCMFGGLFCLPCVLAVFIFHLCACVFFLSFPDKRALLRHVVGWVVFPFFSCPLVSGSFFFVALLCANVWIESSGPP